MKYYRFKKQIQFLLEFTTFYVVFFSNILGKLDIGSLYVISFCSYSAIFLCLQHRVIDTDYYKNARDDVTVSWLLWPREKINYHFTGLFLLYLLYQALLYWYQYYINISYSFIMSPYFIFMLAVKFDFCFHIFFSLIHRKFSVASRH